MANCNCAELNAKDIGSAQYGCSKCAAATAPENKADIDQWEFLARMCPAGRFGIDADDEFAAAFAKEARGAVLSLVSRLRESWRRTEQSRAEVKRWEDKEVFRSVCCDDAHRALDEMFQTFVAGNEGMTEQQQRAAKTAFRVLEGMRAAAKAETRS
jgi:hypothetical protein